MTNLISDLGSILDTKKAKKSDASGVNTSEMRPVPYLNYIYAVIEAELDSDDQVNRQLYQEFNYTLRSDTSESQLFTFC